jgi:hypothetical protein
MSGMRVLTRQDHIDPQVSQVMKCNAHGMAGSHPNILVTFTNGEWVCSSGHNSSYDKLPSLRTTQYDSGAWVMANAVKVAKMLPLEACHDHEPDAKPTNWMPDGHLWTDGNNAVLKLCMPRLVTHTGPWWPGSL